MTRPGKIQSPAGSELRVFRSIGQRGGDTKTVLLYITLYCCSLLWTQHGHTCSSQRQPEPSQPCPSPCARSQAGRELKTTPHHATQTCSSSKAASTSPVWAGTLPHHSLPHHTIPHHTPQYTIILRYTCSSSKTASSSPALSDPSVHGPTRQSGRELNHTIPHRKPHCTILHYTSSSSNVASSSPALCTAHFSVTPYHTARYITIPAVVQMRPAVRQACPTFWTLQSCENFTIPHHTIPHHTAQYHTAQYHTIHASPARASARPTTPVCKETTIPP